MAVTCPAIADAQFLSSILAHIDCQAQNLGGAGYQALAAPDSPAVLLLTGAFTIFVAVIGYRLLLGETPTLRDGVVAMIKIGVVLVLATSWPAFRTLVYDTTLRAPAEVATAIGAPAAVPGAGGGLVAQLQSLDDGLAELNVTGSGKPPNADLIVGPTVPLSAEQAAEQMRKVRDQGSRPRWDPARDISLLGSARTLFLTGAIAPFAAVRLFAALLLALAPLFAIFLLFDGTRGLFEGWLRGLVGAALGALASAILLGVELALVGPWLAAVIDLRRQNIATPAVPIELLVVTLVFVIALAAALIAAAKVAAGFRLPTAWPGRRTAIAGGADDARSVDRRGQDRAGVAENRNRAAAIADAVAATQRRERGATPIAPARLTLSTTATTDDARMARAAPGEATVARPVPIGQSYRRRTVGRVSAGAIRRDGAR